MSNGPSVILVDDEEHVRRAGSQTLELAGYAVEALGDPEAALARLSPDWLGVLISDIKMPGSDGLTLMRRVLAIDPELPVVLITGHGDVPMAVQAMRDGAYDFIEKPFPSDRLTEAVKRAFEKRRLTLENRKLRAALDDGSDIAGRIIGRAPAIDRLRETIATLAATEADVLLQGETGTGKELVARCLHDLSPRREAGFVAINCGALPANIIESELFGHEAGAFTGAAKRRIGKFEFANGGTVFLDEVESMPLELQVKLLRVLQERLIERLGSNETVPIDVRVIAATKRDLAEASAEGEFREDLYYRLNVVALTLPPLRGRLEDVPLLFRHFVDRAALRQGRTAPAIEEDTLASLMAHRWPGNVRELQNAAERYVLGLALPDDDDREAAADGTPGLVARVEAFEREMIARALDQAKGNVRTAAETLRLPRKTLYDKLQKYGLSGADFRGEVED
jgi:two-component system C4-dicarboxylate transport response regulator DctD